MSGLAKRNESGRLVEHCTEAFLLDHLWALKFSVDLGGAVFLVQSTTRSVESLPQQPSTRPVAVVQSKYCGDTAEAEVPRLFVERLDRHLTFGPELLAEKNELEKTLVLDRLDEPVARHQWHKHPPRRCQKVMALAKSWAIVLQNT